MMIQAIRTWHKANPTLTVATFFNLTLALLALAALPFDHRHILGLDPWIKPLKFDLSTAIYTFTAAVYLRLLDPAFPLARRCLAIVIGVSMMAENIVISLQSLRGVPSHMNFTTPFNAGAFAVMGFFILANTVAVAILFLLYCRAHPHLPKAITLGARFGLFALLAGSLEGFFIVQHLAHTVGAPDGGPGLPFLNWSTAHGDLRVAHFFALHCLQAMPLLGWALARTTLRINLQLLTLTLAFLLYMTFVGLLFHQALAGHPLLP